MNEVEELATVARTHPQAAYAALTHGMASKWTYLMRTVEATQQLLQPLEGAIRQLLLPVITGKSDISDLERDLCQPVWGAWVFLTLLPHHQQNTRHHCKSQHH